MVKSLGKQAVLKDGTTTWSLLADGSNYQLYDHGGDAFIYEARSPSTDIVLPKYRRAHGFAYNTSYMGWNNVYIDQEGIATDQESSINRVTQNMNITDMDFATTRAYYELLGEREGENFKLNLNIKAYVGTTAPATLAFIFYRELRRINASLDSATNILTSVGHGLSAGDRVTFADSDADGSENLDANIIYEVPFTDLTSDTFRLETGAASVNLTATKTVNSIMVLDNIGQNTFDVGNTNYTYGFISGDATIPSGQDRVRILIAFQNQTAVDSNNIQYSLQIA